MPRAEIATKQAVYTLGLLLHAELAGKLLANKREPIRLRTAMMQVEAARKMLQPDSMSPASPRNAATRATLWFKRGTLFRSAAGAASLVAKKAPQATRKQAIDLQAAILAALRKRNGGMVGESAPARWKLAAH
jgi:hypothetical protein